MPRECAIATYETQEHTNSSISIYQILKQLLALNWKYSQLDSEIINWLSLNIILYIVVYFIVKTKDNNSSRNIKDASETSNTLISSQFLVKYFSGYDTECEIVRLAVHDIKSGTYTNVDSYDWPEILKKILDSNIVIFATPVWWGIQSSLIQRVIERLNELHDEIMDIGKSKLTNKVVDIIVTGDSDGAQHIIGNLANFFIALGLTIPPFGTLTVLWSGFAKKSDKSKEKKLKYLEDNYKSKAKKAVQNLTIMTDLLKKNPYPK